MRSHFSKHLLSALLSKKHDYSPGNYTANFLFSYKISIFIKTNQVYFKLFEINFKIFFGSINSLPCEKKLELLAEVLFLISYYSSISISYCLIYLPVKKNWNFWQEFCFWFLIIRVFPFPTFCADFKLQMSIRKKVLEHDSSEEKWIPFQVALVKICSRPIRVSVLSNDVRPSHNLTIICEKNRNMHIFGLEEAQSYVLGFQRVTFKLCSELWPPSLEQPLFLIPPVYLTLQYQSHKETNVLS